MEPWTSDKCIPEEGELAATAARLCKEYLMGVRRCGASGREALVEDLAKGAPMLHNRTKDPVSWREKRSLSPIGHQHRLETAQEGVLGQTNQEATLKA